MNSDDGLMPNMQVDPPADVLDLAIDALGHAIPVFDDRQLHRGVNTRYAREFASFLSSLAQDIASSTQFTRRKQIIPATPKLAIVKEMTLKAAGELEALTQQEQTTEDANANGRRFLVAMSQGHIGGLLNAISDLESHWGSFHIWTKHPKRSLCESLIRAWRKGDLDSEDFLVWFRTDQLGLLGPELDPYIAQVLLGMRVSGGQVLLPGDLHNLAGKSENEIFAVILSMARARKLADEYGSEDLARVGPPGEDVVARRFDALSRTTFLQEIGELFKSSESVETVMRAAIIEALNREDFERVFRRVGLPREVARFAARLSVGRATATDDPNAAKLIAEEQDAIRAAMREDPKFSTLFG
jgi:hypothetical protein